MTMPAFSDRGIAPEIAYPEPPYVVGVRDSKTSTIVPALGAPIRNPCAQTGEKLQTAKQRL